MTSPTFSSGAKTSSVELHDGLKDLRTGLGHGLTVGGLGGDFEGEGAGTGTARRGRRRPPTPPQGHLSGPCVAPAILLWIPRRLAS
jgi:hypothetical protein